MKVFEGCVQLGDEFAVQCAQNVLLKKVKDASFFILLFLAEYIFLGDFSQYYISRSSWAPNESTSFPASKLNAPSRNRLSPNALWRPFLRAWSALRSVCCKRRWRSSARELALEMALDFDVVQLTRLNWQKELFCWLKIYRNQDRERRDKFKSIKNQFLCWEHSTWRL